jgi:hypothetical protein
MASEAKSGAFRMLAVTPLMGATSLYRASVGYADAWYKQAPGLVGLWFDAIEPGGDQVKSATELRAKLLQASRDSITCASDELTRGVSDLERFGATPGTGAAGVAASGGVPSGVVPPTGPPPSGE